MARILLLGPDRDRAAGIRSLLRQDGHQVTWLRSLSNWRAREGELLPDVVVASMGSTEGVLDGSRGPVAGFAPPLLIVQQEADFLGELHQEERLVDRLQSPFMGDELLGRVDALVRVRRLIRKQGTESTSSRSEARGFFSWLRNRLPSEERPVAPYLEVAARLAEWADRRDAFRPGHAERVTSFCAMIAEALQMDEDGTSELLRAAVLHDIGKVALPVEVLRKKGPLEESQFRLIRTHPSRGAALLRALDPDEGVARVVLYHHERPDGSGYYGKEGGGVPKSAYVLAVAEAYDAMMNSLVREQLDSKAAMGLLQSTKGSTYDAECVEALVDQLKPRVACIPLSVCRP